MKDPILKSVGVKSQSYSYIGWSAWMEMSTPMPGCARDKCSNTNDGSTRVSSEVRRVSQFPRIEKEICACPHTFTAVRVGYDEQ